MTTLTLTLSSSRAYAQADKGIDWVDTYGTPKEVGVGRYVALVFAAQDYRSGTGVPDLKTPNRDAAEIGKVLEDQYGFEVRVYPDATRGDIFSAMETLAAELTEDDVVLLYYAGHGVVRPDEKLGYWLPIDADENISTNWVSTADISAKVRAMRARHVLVIADSCYAGEFTDAREIVTSAPLDAPVGREEARELASARSRWVITSGGLEPVADGGADGMSVFGYFLRETLRRSEDRYVVPDRFFPVLRSAVVRNSDQTPAQGKLVGGMQTTGQPVLINQKSCLPEEAEVLSARRVEEADLDWQQVVRSNAGKGDRLYRAAIVEWIGRWSQASVRACGQDVPVEIPRMAEAAQLRDALSDKAGGNHGAGRGLVVGGSVLAATGAGLTLGTYGWWTTHRDRFAVGDRSLVPATEEDANVFRTMRVVNLLGGAVLGVGAGLAGYGTVQLAVRHDGDGPAVGMVWRGRW